MAYQTINADPNTAFLPPSPTKAKRLASTSANIQSLFQRSSAASPSAPRTDIDARSLAAKPPGQTLENALAAGSGIDARALAASPRPNAPRFTIRREIWDKDSRRGGGAREEGASMRPTRQRFDSGPPGGDRERASGDRSRSFNAGRSPQRTPRAGKSEGKGKRGNRDKASGSGGGGSRGASKQDAEEYEKMMAEYRKEREAQLAPKPVAFEPKMPSREELLGSGPGFVSGVWGMREILGEKKAAAEKYVQGRQWIEEKGAWESGRVKGEVLELVEGLEVAAGGTENGKGEKQVAKAEKGGEGELLTKLFSGGYITQHPGLRSSGKQDVLAQVARQTALNGSYELDDEKSLLGKVRSLVAATPPKGGGKPVGQQQRAKP